MKKGITIGVIVGAGGTCISALPILTHNWHPPDWVAYVICAPYGLFHFFGFRIAQAIHDQHCARLGCRDIHIAWAFWWSLGINTVIGGLIGALVSWIKNKIGSRTSH